MAGRSKPIKPAGAKTGRSHRQDRLVTATNGVDLEGLNWPDLNRPRLAGFGCPPSAGRMVSRSGDFYRKTGSKEGSLQAVAGVGLPEPFPRVRVALVALGEMKKRGRHEGFVSSHFFSNRPVCAQPPLLDEATGKKPTLTAL